VPPEPVFFVDADLSDKWFFRILEEAGVAFERHDDHLKLGRKTLDWPSSSDPEGLEVRRVWYFVVGGNDGENFHSLPNPVVYGVFVPMTVIKIGRATCR